MSMNQKVNDNKSSVEEVISQNNNRLSNIVQQSNANDKKIIINQSDRHQSNEQILRNQQENNLNDGKKSRKRVINLNNMIKIMFQKGNNLRQKMQNETNEISKFIYLLTNYCLEKQEGKQQSVQFLQEAYKYKSKPQSFIYSKKYEHRNPQTYYISIILNQNQSNDMIVRFQQNILCFYTVLSQIQIIQRIRQLTDKISEGSLIIVIKQYQTNQKQKENLALIHYLNTMNFDYIFAECVINQLNMQENFKFNIKNLSLKGKNRYSPQIYLKNWQKILFKEKSILRQIRGKKLYKQIITGFDCMLIYAHYQQGIPLLYLSSNIIQIAQKKRQQIKMNLQAEEKDFYHYPIKMERCKNCKVCKGQKKKGKSIYKCQGCSFLYNIDITLCVDKTQTNCFRKFHENEELYALDMKTNKRLIPITKDKRQEGKRQVETKQFETTYQSEQQNKQFMNHLTQCVSILDQMMEKQLNQEEYQFCMLLINTLTSKINAVTQNIYPELFFPKPLLKKQQVQFQNLNGSQ